MALVTRSDALVPSSLIIVSSSFLLLVVWPGATNSDALCSVRSFLVETMMYPLGEVATYIDPVDPPDRPTIGAEPTEPAFHAVTVSLEVRRFGSRCSEAPKLKVPIMGCCPTPFCCSRNISPTGGGSAGRSIHLSLTQAGRRTTPSPQENASSWEPSHRNLLHWPRY